MCSSLLMFRGGGGGDGEVTKGISVEGKKN